MKLFGAWLIAWGTIAIMLSFVGMQIGWLWFMDEFGPIVGIIFKAGLIAAGVWVWRNDDRAPADVDDDPVAGRSPWVPVIVSGVVIVGTIGVVGLNIIRNYLLDQQLQRLPAAAAWASTPATNWPALVLLQKAEFKHHTSMEAGCASLVRLPSGDVVALTAGHLLGKDGGVEPGFMHGNFGGLDGDKLATLGGEIISWKLFLPEHEKDGVEVSGLFGNAKKIQTDCDQLLLSLSAPARTTTNTAKPLDVRLTSVDFTEHLHVIAYDVDEQGDFRQVVYHAHRIPGMGFTCELEKPAILQGCSGAPVVDDEGLVVGIVTGGTFMDMASKSAYVHGFSGRLLSELMPSFKAALTHKGNSGANQNGVASRAAL